MSQTPCRACGRWQKVAARARSPVREASSRLCPGSDARLSRVWSRSRFNLKPAPGAGPAAGVGAPRARVARGGRTDEPVVRPGVPRAVTGIMVTRNS